ncbi:MAG: sigma-70 family RNA polymerase sigma factor [Proteobacteria bacterium]|nr:sigma-70 family RNA polymerase sigma factor [Pseudomonadota bacterium]
MPDKRSKRQDVAFARAEQGSEAQAELLVRDNIAWMLALSERILRDRGLAEDAVQEAFIAAFRGLDNFERRSTLETWLHRITVNASLTKLRQLKRLAEKSIDEYLPEFDRHDCRIEAPWTNLAPLEEILENDDLRATVKKAIDALPESYRIVLQLRDIEGYDTNEVAELLEISGANVKVRLHRARAAIKKLLEPVLRGEVRG